MWEKYKNHVAAQMPSEASVAALKQKAAQQKPTEKLLLRGVAAAASLVVLVMTLVVSQYIGGTQINRSVKPAESYDELFQAIAFNRSSGLHGFFDRVEVEAEQVSPTNNQTAKGQHDFSDTNQQVAGVQEGDIVKTDGSYIYLYSATSECIKIIRADNGNLQQLSEISIDKDRENRYINELYLYEDIMAVICQRYVYRDADNDIIIEPVLDAWYYRSIFDVRTEVYIYDIANRASPVLKDVLGQDGSITASRSIGDKLYLVTSKTLYSPEDIDREHPETFVPSVYSNGTSRLIESKDCFFDQGNTYTIVTGMDIKTSRIISSGAVLDWSSQVYCSAENLYLTNGKQNVTTADAVQYSKNSTGIIRFGLSDGNVELKAQTTVPGEVNNQFSMDEYNGTFRLVTTLTEATYDNSEYAYSEKTSNNLFVLNLNLETIGKIENLAEGERIYSARFDGITAYFVTFRQVDPLFTVDLTIPEQPIIKSELKIPGFSNYLHVYGEGRLFGLGVEADENGKTSGLKLSMFDTTDPNAVFEAAKFNIDSEWSSSEAQYNHKAILINAERNIIAFPVYTAGMTKDGTEWENGYYYMVFRYGENGFEKVAEIQNRDGDEWYNFNTRGLYIDNYLYIISDSAVCSYSLDSFIAAGKLQF